LFLEINPIKSGLVLFDNCWIDGDDAIKENDEAKLGVIQQLQHLFKVRTAKIKKL
jgi:hypothetical protein